MLRKFAFSLVFLLMAMHPLLLDAQWHSTYFTKAALRIDYMHSGTADTEAVNFVRFVNDSVWAGNPNRLIDPFGYGRYIVKVYDVASSKLIFTTGFCTLFEEWQTTEEARLISKSFEESIIIPYPKGKTRIELWSRKRDNSMTKIQGFMYSPDSEVEHCGKIPVKITNYLASGNCSNRLDIAVVADGYTASEAGKFQDDAKRLTDFLLNDPAIKPMRNLINVYFILPASIESGTDIPGEGIWVNTALNSRFYTFGSDRYLTTASYHRLRDVVSDVPTDQIIVIVNTERYGGGGIYNFYSVTCSSNAYAGKVLAHEFGHAFAALGDEYYTSETSYIDFYPLDVEPYQPNITTLINFDSKWKKMINDSVPVPTPDEFQYRNILGVFEGGGYVAKGVYRPMTHCRMKELDSPFCKVCTDAIHKMTDYYTIEK